MQSKAGDKPPEPLCAPVHMSQAAAAKEAKTRGSQSSHSSTSSW